MKKLFVSIILFVTSLGFSQDWNYNFEEAKKIFEEIKLEYTHVSNELNQIKGTMK